MKKVDFVFFLILKPLLLISSAALNQTELHRALRGSPTVEYQSDVTSMEPLEDYEIGNRNYDSFRHRDDVTFQEIVTPNPSELNFQIRPPLVNMRTGLVNNQPTSPYFKKEVTSPSGIEYSAEYLLISLSNHRVTMRNCMANHFSPELCQDMIQLSNMHYHPKFKYDERSNVDNFRRPDNLEFALNSASLNDLWENHLNRDNKLAFDIIDTSYDELIYYFDPPVDPNFKVPRMSVPYYNERTYGVNRAGTPYLYSKPLISTSELEPRIVVHAPSGFSTNVLMDAMKAGFSHPRQSSTKNLRGEASSTSAANLPFGHFHSNQREQGSEVPPLEEKYSSFLTELNLAENRYVTETPETFYLPASSNNNPPDEVYDYYTHYDGTSSSKESFAETDSVVEEPFLRSEKASTRIIVRLKSGANGVPTEFEIPSSNIDQNGMTEIKLKSGQRLRLRIKKKKTTDEDLGDYYYDNNLDSLESLDEHIEQKLDIAYDSADGFLKNMFGGMNTGEYYENILTLVAIASFVGFVYARGINIFNSVSLALAKEEAWWQVIKKREDLQGMSGILKLIQEAIKKFSGDSDLQDSSWVPLEESSKTTTTFAPNNPYTIAKRTLNVSEYYTTTSTPWLQDDLTIINQFEDAAKIGASMIDAALELRVSKQNKSGSSCLAKPLCELNKRFGATEGVMSLFISVMSTFSQWLEIEPDDPFEIINVFRPLWLSQAESESCDRILACPSTFDQLLSPLF